jgi:hypothetical protein
MFDSAHNGQYEAHQATMQERFGCHWTHCQQLRHVDPGKRLVKIYTMPWAAYLVIIAFVPSGTVHQLALEIMKSGDAGPLPGI